ncbi:hypothetical protein DL765_001815 [Monosporascus sp. GIB2]|nr:hypothetical protein DL765_001815 [Monosporascus sp. GIB2]
MLSTEGITVESLPELLKDDNKVKLAGVDVDGILRGKLMSKKKFLSIASSGFGFCSVIFGWDMHDMTYIKELKVSNQENGYRDLVAIPDLASFRRIPWEDNVPFFLVSFFDPDTMEPVCACPRGLLKTMLERLKKKGYDAMAGAEYEFFQFKTPSTESPSTYLRDNAPQSLPPLTEGMFGYSITRPVQNQGYYYDVYDACAKFECDLEGWHTESGPGVYEAALEFGQISGMADRASLFKYVVKGVATKYGITPCFMAKPRAGLPGNSGHIHVSVVDKDGKNLLFRDTKDENAQYPDIAELSDLGRHFLAGILDGLADVMPMVAPTINSYKRLVENFWAPVTVSWGLENRAASIRLIAPPTSKPGATRFEVRVAGADANPYYVMAAILGLGWRGVEKKLEIPYPPLGKGQDVGGSEDKGERLAKSLKEATERFMRKESVAREVFGDGFVDHFGGTREHEVRLWDEAVTDWELKRYIETGINLVKTKVRSAAILHVISQSGNDHLAVESSVLPPLLSTNVENDVLTRDICVDKNSINFVNAFGLQEGRNPSRQDFSLHLLLRMHGLLVPFDVCDAAIPRGPLRVPDQISWDVILLTAPACSSFANTATNRFLLGLFEAAVNPTANGIATTPGAPVDYAVGHSGTGLPWWMYVFLIFEALSFVQGIASLLFPSDLPSTTRSLTPIECAIAIERVSSNRQGAKNQHFKKYRAVQCLKDPKSLILFVTAVGAQISNSALTSFAGMIIRNFGFDQLGTQYMQVPGGRRAVPGSHQRGYRVHEVARQAVHRGNGH